MSRQERQALADAIPSWWHSIELGEGAVSRGHKAPERHAAELEGLRLPDLEGRTVLDIGALDGFYSFHAEEQGAARVVALDHYVWGLDRSLGKPKTPDPELDLEGLPGRRGFELAHRLRESRVEPLVADFMETDLEGLGRFDIVLFLGVLYHLREPLTALRRLRRVTRELAVIETHAILVPGFEDRPLWELYPERELADSFSNWWGPNAAGLLAACRAAGFAHAELASPPDEPWDAGGGRVYSRLIAHAWPQRPANASEADPAAATAPLARRVAGPSWRVRARLRALARRLRR